MADGRWQFLREQVCGQKEKSVKKINYYIYNINIIYIIKFLFPYFLVLMRKLPSAICTTQIKN